MSTTIATTASNGHRSSRFSSSFKWGALGFGTSAIALAALKNNVFGEEAKSNTSTLIPAAPPTEEEMAKLLEEDNVSSKPHSMLGKVGLVLYNYLIEPLFVFRRFIVLALIFGPVILSIPLLFLGPPVTTKTSSGDVVQGERRGALWWYSFLVAQMGRAGPTFVKLGQWAGSRRDLFPDALCDKFAKLHSNNDPHAFRYTKKVLEHAFQKPFDEIFESFEHKAVGVGAVGQVYKAVVRSELLPASYFEAKHQQESHMPEAAQRIGEELALMYEHDEARRPTAAVAIKVLHPNVRRTIRHDIRIMRFFANLINILPGMEWVSLPEEVQQFSTLMFSQLDLRHEANNLARFERNFAKRNSAISFPRPLLEFCSKDVLVEELIEAVPLKYFLEMGGLDYDERIADLGLDAFLVRNVC
ncbi:hypothetical protein MYAM1_002361 [Malassezia yamatoensis]|uniref:ABC1 atypical kinase-like domain-containing protein n=1 Tax=Malassezia yamatoensis TaxID=253288 RepID=A0AAJ5YTS4_9BASI|nr:hypothetical protein MYAM1_002361 [Malassezia yamatoensis]